MAEDLTFEQFLSDKPAATDSFEAFVKGTAPPAPKAASAAPPGVPEPPKPAGLQEPAIRPIDWSGTKPRQIPQPTPEQVAPQLRGNAIAPGSPDEPLNPDKAPHPAIEGAADIVKDFVRRNVLGDRAVTLEEPTVRPSLGFGPETPQDTDLKAGLRAFTQGLEGMTSRESLALIAGTAGLGSLGLVGKAVQSGIASYFAVKSATGATQNVVNAYDLYQKGDTHGAAQELGLGGSQGLMTALGVYGAVAGGRPVADAIKSAYDANAAIWNAYGPSSSPEPPPGGGETRFSGSETRFPNETGQPGGKPVWWGGKWTWPGPPKDLAGEFEAKFPQQAPPSPAEHGPVKIRFIEPDGTENTIDFGDYGTDTGTTTAKEPKPSTVTERFTRADGTQVEVTLQTEFAAAIRKNTPLLDSIINKIDLNSLDEGQGAPRAGGGLLDQITGEQGMRQAADTGDLGLLAKPAAGGFEEFVGEESAPEPQPEAESTPAQPQQEIPRNAATEQPRVEENPPAPPAAEPEGAGRPHVVAEQKPKEPGHELEDSSGDEVKVKTARGTVASARYNVVEADDLKASHDTALNVNPNYPQELQPRDRTRAASETQISQIAARLDPNELGHSYKASDGAPIVTPDGTVVSGNGRTIALQRLYQSNHENGETYRQWLIDNAEDFGLSPDDIETMRRPVLVRTIDPAEMDLPAFARESNEAGQAAMSATELAKSDADRLTGTQMAIFNPSEEGDILASGNRSFVQAFAKDIVAEGERGTFMDAAGQLSQAGVQRIRNAIFAKAYGADTGTLEHLAESTDSNIRNITAGMVQAAGPFAKMREGIASGDLHNVDLAPEVAEAAGQLAALRREGHGVQDYLKQIGLFGEAMTQEGKALLDLFDRYGRSPKKIGAILRRIVDAVEAAGSPKQGGLFAGTKAPTKQDILAAAIRKAEEDFDEGRKKGTPEPSLFDEGEPAASPGAREPDGQKPAGAKPKAEGTAPPGAKPRKEQQEPVGPAPAPHPGGPTGGAPRPKPAEKPVETKPEHPPLSHRLARRAREFAKEEKGELDVTQLAEVVVSARTDLRKIANPTALSPEALVAGESLRAYAAEAAQTFARAEVALAEARKFFAPRPWSENLDFIDRVEDPQIAIDHPDPHLDAIAATMRQLLDAHRLSVQALGKNKLTQFYVNYFPHIWQRPGQTESVWAQILGRRPIEGTKNFLKQRKLKSFREGVDGGLHPVSENPVDLVLLKLREMERYILAHRYLNEMRSNGLAKFVPATGKGNTPPEGWVKIPDSIGTVWRPPLVPVKEAFDKEMVEGLQALLDRLGIEHGRGTKVRGKGGEWGLAISRPPKILTKFAGPESVIVHEIGHQLDYRYGLANQLTKKHTAQGNLFGIDADELRALADLRLSGGEPAWFERYVHRPAEMVANMVAAYTHNRARMQRVAPNVFRFFRDFIAAHPELAALQKIEYGMQLTESSSDLNVGGFIQVGFYYMPAGAAQIISNYLSPGLGFKPWYQVLRGTANLMLQFALGFSAFHAGFTTMDAAISKLAIAMRYLGEGHPAKAIAHAVLVPAAPVINVIKGNRIRNGYLKGTLNDPETAKYVEALVAGGGRVRMDDVYRTNFRKAFMDGLRQHKVGKVALTGLPALAETAVYPILELLVPRQKLGVFADLVDFELTRLGPNATQQQIRHAMSKAWDSVDNRMGQLVYDNLFWNRTLKDLMMITVQSLGWNLGTFREVGGAGADTLHIAADVGGRIWNGASGGGRGRRGGAGGGGGGRAAGDPLFTHRMAYTASMFLLVGLIGAVILYLAGKKAKHWRDYYYPLGWNLPSYVKDVFHWFEDPTQAAANKLNPLVRLATELARNRDFFNVEIFNSNDQLQTIGFDLLKEVGSFFVSFAMRNQIALAKGGASTVERALPFVGITKAPAYATHTKAQQLLAEYLGETTPRSAQTRESWDRKQARKELEAAVRRKDPQAKRLALESLQAGRITPKDLKLAVANVGKDQDGGRISYLAKENIEHALEVYRAADPEERAKFRPALLKAVLSALRNESPEQVKALVGRFRPELIDLRGRK